MDTLETLALTAKKYPIIPRGQEVDEKVVIRTIKIQCTIMMNGDHGIVVPMTFSVPVKD